MTTSVPSVVRFYLEAVAQENSSHLLQLAVSEDVSCEFFAAGRSTKVKGRLVLDEILKRRRALIKELAISTSVGRVSGDWISITFVVAGTKIPRRVRSTSDQGLAFMSHVKARYRLQKGRIVEMTECWRDRS